MKFPKTDEHFTQIPNEVLEGFYRINLFPYAISILAFLWRKIYGFHKKTDRIASSQFTKFTGLDRRLVHRTLKRLESYGLIFIHRDDGAEPTYGFQEDPKKWKILPRERKVISGDDNNCARQGIETTNPVGCPTCPRTKPPDPSSLEMTKLSSPEMHTKENIKEKILGEPRNPEVKTFIAFWCEKFHQKTGEKYTVTGGKEGTIVKGLLNTYSLERLKDLAETFFRQEDPFIRDVGFTIGIFKWQINKLVSQKRNTGETEDLRRTQERFTRQEEARAGIANIASIKSTPNLIERSASI